MFGAVGFRGFRENDAAAMAHQQIAGDAEGGVGGDAGQPIRAAALQGERNFRRRDGNAGHIVGFCQNLADKVHAGGDGLAGAAHGLDIQAAQPAGELLFLHQPADLVHLAAQAQHDHMRKIGVPGEAAQGAAQQFQRFLLRHAAAGLVGEGDDTVHVWVFVQGILALEGITLEHAGDEFGDMGGAVHGREDTDIVAGGDAPVRAADAHEAGLRVKESGRGGGFAEGIVLGEVAHAAIMHMHMPAGADVLGGEADDLAVAADSFARRDGTQGNLVAGGDALGRSGPLSDLDPLHQSGAGDQHVVVRMQRDDEGWGHGRLQNDGRNDGFAL